VTRREIAEQLAQTRFFGIIEPVTAAKFNDAEDRLYLCCFDFPVVYDLHGTLLLFATSQNAGNDRTFLTNFRP
jgi:hypothetical protein